MYSELTAADFEAVAALDSRRPAVEPWQVLALGPSAIFSVLNFISEYKEVTAQLPKRVQDRIGSAAVMVFSLWAYCEVSGRSLKQLQAEDVLSPALLLYIVAVTQDDCFDELNLDHPGIAAADCYWGTYAQEGREEIDFKAEYDWAIAEIMANENLSLTVREYLVSLLANSWSECQSAEDQQVAMRNELVDIAAAHDLKKKSYGVLGEALTEVLNGSVAMTEKGQQTADAMVAFCLMGGIIDGMADIEEDRGQTVSTVIAAEQRDQALDLPKNTTAHIIFQTYLAEIQNKKVIVASVILSKLYPVMVGLHKLSSNFFKVCVNPVSFLFKV